MKKIFLGYPFALGYVRRAVGRAVGDLARVEVASDTLRALPLLTKIDRMVDEADLCLFDLTQHNPNVAAEFGVAYKAGKKWAILYCADEKLNPKPGRESSVFSDVKGWDSILYRDAEHLEAELRRLLPEYLAAAHVGIRTTSVAADPSIRPRLNMDLKMDYALAMGHTGPDGRGASVQKFGDDKLSVKLRNVGAGTANDVRIAMTGIRPVFGVQTIEPGGQEAVKMPLEDQEAYHTRPQFPAITVEYEDDNGAKYQQVGVVNARPQDDGTFRYDGRGLKAPALVSEFSLHVT